jgi:hypothetical protein
MPPGVVNPPPAVVAVAQRSGTWRTQLSELHHFDSYIAGLRNTEEKPILIPLVGLTASERNGLDEKSLAGWVAGHGWIAGLSSRGEQRLVPRSSHAMPLDQPQAIVQAVRDVLVAVAPAQ